MTSSLKYKSMGNKSPLQRKRYGIHGHATFNLDRAQLRKWITAAAKLLPDEVVSEFAGMLSTLATARPQGSVRGLKAADKADAILWHIAKQRGDKTSRLMLASAAAVLSYQPMPTSSPMFLKVQCARAVWRLLKSDFIQLYGRRHRQKIGLQSRFVALELFKRVEPVLYFWLKDGGRAAITRKVAGQSACQNLDTPHL